MAVNSNIRAAAGAKKGLNSALQIALRGGAVTGLAVTALSLLGVSSLFLIYGGYSGNDILIKEAPSLIVGFGFVLHLLHYLHNLVVVYIQKLLM